MSPERQAELLDLFEQMAAVRASREHLREQLQEANAAADRFLAALKAARLQEDELQARFEELLDETAGTLATVPS